MAFVEPGTYTLTQVNVADPADLTMRAKYQEIGKAEGITSEQMFGKKGEVSLREHNVGTASGWGGLTAERAVYPSIYSESIEPQTMTLRDVPTEAYFNGEWVMPELELVE